MAGLAHNRLYSNESQTPLQWQADSRQADDECTLDDSILDNQPYDMATAENPQRRESFASNASLMSPTQHGWHDYSYSNEPTATYPGSTDAVGLFPENGANQFSHPTATQFAQYGSHMAPWHQQNSLGSDSTHSAFSTFPSDLEAVKPEVTYSNEGAPVPQGNVYGGLPVQVESEYVQYPMSAASPQWSTSSSDAVEKIPRSGHLQSPMFNHNLPHLRRDGVRKKNARFDIPEGRNLQTIDELINSANPNNEDEIKELKQQKRLLRNRQAALDSRCRKKHHTEKLEEEKKHFLAAIDRLEDENRNLQMNSQKLMQDCQQWHHYSEDLIRQKEELVRQHTVETAELRRRNAILISTAERLEGAAMSAQASSNGTSVGFPDFENLTMDSSPFDDFSFIENPVMDVEAKQESSLILQPKKESATAVIAEDKSVASSLLLMLLLCGAWVASRNNTASNTVIPRMPDDVRAASAVVLENIYQDAGLQPQISSQGNTDSATTTHARPNRASTHSRTASSPLASLHRELVTPSHQQQRDQAFSLSVDQYNHITSDNAFDLHQEPSQPPRRQNLSEALTAMRAQKQGPAGEVYTRSLMMDRVPADVVRDFARMMEESRRGNSSC